MLPDRQQKYLDQIALVHRKIAHLEETLKIEEKEKEMENMRLAEEAQEKKEAELRAKKKEEDLALEISIQREENERRNLVQKMVVESDKSFGAITKVLVNFEGNIIFC